MHKSLSPSLTRVSSPEKVNLMKLSITTELDLAAPTMKKGYVTWLDVKLVEDGRTFGTARVALVHVGEIADAHGDLWPALRGTRLEALHDVYFSQGWYNDDFADGAGIDLLFVESVELDESARNRNFDLALVRRLAESIGSGCQLVVMAYKNPMQAAYWAQIGFSVTTGGRGAGFMHMKLGYRHASVVDVGVGVGVGESDYRLMSSDAPTGDAPN